MKLIRTLGLGALLGSALAAPAHAFDLLQALQAARQYDAGYASASAANRAGAEKAVQGRALLLPSVGLSASTTQNKPLQPAAGNYRSDSLGVQLTQPLFDTASYSGYQKGKIASTVAQLQFDASGQQLVIDVARAYFDALLAEDVLNVTRATKSAYERQLAQARKAFEVGTATITDTHEAQAGYDAATAQEIAALSDLDLKRNALAQLTGLNPESIRRLRDKPQLSAADLGTLETWTQRAQQNSLALQLQQQQLVLAEKNLDEARGKHLPTVSLNAGYSHNRSTDASSVASGRDTTRGSSLGLSLTLPLYAGGAIDSQVTEAAANRDKAREDLEAARRQNAQNVRRSWLGVSNGAALVRAQEQLLVSAKSKLDATRLGKDVGVRTNLDLLNAEKDYQDAIRALVQARYNFLQARLALAQAAGTLDDQVVDEVNRFF